MSCDPLQAELQKDFAVLENIAGFLIESVIPKMVCVASKCLLFRSCDYLNF